MSIHVLQYNTLPVRQESNLPPPKYLTITGYISEFRYNVVMEQLTIELGNTGSRFEYWSR